MSAALMGVMLSWMLFTSVRVFAAAGAPGDSPEGVTRITARGPVAAPAAALTVTDACVPAGFTVGGDTVIPDAGSTRTSDAFWKLRPLIVSVTGAAPTCSTIGVIESKAGSGALTRNSAAAGFAKLTCELPAKRRTSRRLCGALPAIVTGTETVSPSG